MGKSVEIREIGLQHVDGSGYSHGMADMVKPEKDLFVKDSKPMRKMVRGTSGDGYAVRITSYATAFLTNPDKKQYRSWYA